MSSRPSLLLVEADPTLLQALSRLLREICQVETTRTALAALDRLDHVRFDILLIDADFPAIDSLALLRDIQAKEISTPVLLLAGAEVSASLSGHPLLDSDDIVSKPIRMAVLLGKIETRLRRSTQNIVRHIGPFIFYAADRCLFEPKTKTTIRLTEKERDILDHLLTNNGVPVSREALLTEIWGYSPLATTHTLETHIYRLRQKLATDSDVPSILVSETGGYRLAL